MRTICSTVFFLFSSFTLFAVSALSAQAAQSAETAQSAPSTRVEEVSFVKVWESISSNSHVQKAVQLESEAGKEAKGRASRHWFPRLYLDVKAYQTNDPGASFIGLLGQRSAEPADLSPEAINYPGQQFYTRGALGIDLPLYEGGVKSAESRMQQHLSDSKDNEVTKVRNEQYSEVVKAFGSIAVMSEQKNKILTMNNRLAQLLKNYKLGVKSNPVGYSGLLGLKSLSNRLQGLLKQYNSQSEALYAAIKEMGFASDTEWKPEFENVLKYTQQFLASEKYKESTNAELIKEKALAAKEVSTIEKARFLPRLGAFAETYAFNGNRDTASGYTAGLYLQWSLFNPADYGTYKESKLRAAAAENYALAAAQNERSEYQSLLKSAESLRSNIELLNDSEKNMSEQVQVTENLFKNGSVNALQFLEVLSSRVDLVESQTEVFLSFIKVESEKILKTRFIIQTKPEGSSL